MNDISDESMMAESMTEEELMEESLFKAQDALKAALAALAHAHELCDLADYGPLVTGPLRDARLSLSSALDVAQQQM
jgi:hypothetical protein